MRCTAAIGERDAAAGGVCGAAAGRVHDAAMGGVLACAVPLGLWVAHSAVRPGHVLLVMCW